MPDLNESLHGRDLGFLRIVAELWGLEVSAPNARRALQELVSMMLDPDLVDEVVVDLPGTAQQALNDLIQNGGRLSWALFTRRYGSVREMGPGRRDREQPHLNSPSPAEMLWYRSLVSRAFFDAPTGPEEFAYIPADLFILIPSTFDGIAQPLGRHASPAEKLIMSPATDRILDDACTLLVALRMGFSVSQPDETAYRHFPDKDAAPPTVLIALLTAAGVLDHTGQPIPEPTRQFLEARRPDALVMLVSAWLNSPDFNELNMLPHLRVERETSNQPIKARHAILDFLSQVPAGSWWSLAAFISALHQFHPDYQRPAGDYDSWYIQNIITGEYLRGFEHWDEVDGALVRFTICGPMHWLGLMDLAAPSAESGVGSSAFRLSKWGHDLLDGKAPHEFESEEAPIFARSSGSIQVPRLSPRSVRYQVARFCRWESADNNGYHYRLTPQSLKQARSQGLRVSHLLTLLRKYAKNVPPTLVQALERWEDKGVEAHLEQAYVLRLSNPEILQALRNSAAARYLGDIFGPAAVAVKPGAIDKVLAALVEMGYLAEEDTGLQDR